MSKRTSGTVVLVCGYAMGFFGAVTSDLPLVVFGCWVASIAVWGGNKRVSS